MLPLLWMEMGDGERKKKRNRNYGHFHGVKTVKKIVETAIKIKLPIVTFFVFSTENWKRPKTEINFLFNLVSSYFKAEINNVINNGIKINIIGEINQLPTKLKLILKSTINKTKNNKKIVVNLALNYGSKKELINAVKKIKKDVISEKKLNDNLYTAKMANPDILIRTGGTKRLSNFLLWQLAYTEIFFIDKLWPEFNANIFNNIISKFEKTKRNYGRI